MRATTAAVKEPDPGTWTNTGRDTGFALRVLRNRRRDPRAEIDEARAAALDVLGDTEGATSIAARRLRATHHLRSERH